MKMDKTLKTMPASTKMGTGSSSVEYMVGPQSYADGNSGQMLMNCDTVSKGCGTNGAQAMSPKGK
jgi:hypothetical protein